MVAHTSGASTEHRAPPAQEKTMRVRNLVLAFAIAAVTTSTPALAAAKRAGFNAYASAPGATESNGTDRAVALRECNAATASMREHTWGTQIANAYRSCMAQRGQPE
jgi:hypothetical protein